MRYNAMITLTIEVDFEETSQHEAEEYAENLAERLSGECVTLPIGPDGKFHAKLITDAEVLDVSKLES